MFEFVGNVVQGGWNALSNVTSAVGSGANYMVSSFFPAQQKTTILSETVQGANSYGNTFRSTIPENQSMIQSLSWADSGWFGSPYQNDLSIPVKVAESKNIDSIVSGTQSKSISGMLADIWGGVKSGAGAITKEISEVKTLADDIMGWFGINRGSTVYNGPTETGNSPGTIINTAPAGTSGADVATTTAKGIIDQIKGLFNLGYDQTSVQPVSPVTTSAGALSGLSILLIAGVILFVIFARKK